MPSTVSKQALVWVGGGVLLVALFTAGWRLLSAPSYAAELESGAALEGTRDAVRAPLVAQADDRVFVCDDVLGFGTWDVSEPESPVRVATADWKPRQLDDLKRDGDRLLVDQQAGPTVLDISDPERPRVLSRVPGRDVAVVGDRIYASDSSRVRSARLDGGDSRPLSPELPYAELARLGDSHLLAVSREETADDANVLVWDVSVPSEAELVHSSTLGSVVQDVVVLNRVAYVATTDDGVVVYDVSDPGEPEQVGQVPDLIAFHVYADGDDDRIYVLHDANSVHVLDVSNPHAPRLVAKHETHATGVSAAPGRRVVVGSSDGVRLLELTRAHDAH